MRRNTPCVLGCCGPMLRIISFGSPVPSSSSSAPSNMAVSLLAARRSGLSLGPVPQVAHQHVLVVEHPILAQRMAGEGVLGQDPSQVRVADELHPEQVVDLALLELRARPD